MHPILAAAMTFAMAIPALAQIVVPADVDTIPIPGHQPIAGFRVVVSDSDTVTFTWTAPSPDLELTDHYTAYELRYSRTGPVTVDHWDDPELGTVATPTPAEGGTTE